MGALAGSAVGMGDPWPGWRFAEHAHAQVGIRIDGAPSLLPFDNKSAVTSRALRPHREPRARNGFHLTWKCPMGPVRFQLNRAPRTPRDCQLMLACEGAGPGPPGGRS